MTDFPARSVEGFSSGPTLLALLCATPHTWGTQLKQHTTPCACVNSFFTGRACKGMLLGALSTGPELEPLCFAERSILFSANAGYLSSIRPFSYYFFLPLFTKCVEQEFSENRMRDSA
jgi:hypothetical protein